MTTTLDEMVRVVDLARRTVAQRSAILTERRRDWEAANAEDIDGLKRDQEYLADAEAALRAAAIAVHEETGTKSPTPGVGIRVLTKLRYDQAEAIAWDQDHGGLATSLTLDKRVFEAHAKISRPPFVTVVESAQATIATDLSDVIAAQTGGSL